VTFRYKKDIDQSQSLDYGLIAEDVRPKSIQPWQSVIEMDKSRVCDIKRDQRDVANEFPRKHRKNEEQEDHRAPAKAN
jgi:hypothetical protein